MRVFLFPFALLYGLVVHLRNKLFDWNIVTSKSFPLPVIAVGNLSTGGTGKTPHTEYLIKLMQDNNLQPATLSRGYGRDTKGYIEAGEQSDYHEIGDEPLQFSHKFEGVTVAVDEKRKRGIRMLLKKHPAPGAIILDDAFQHRYVKPDLSILLTDYHNLYTENYLLPTGNLREMRCGAKRADIIIVTKTPSVLSPLDRRQIEAKIKPRPHQKLFFTKITYCKPLPLPGTEPVFDPTGLNTILMFSGIANSYPFQEYLKTKCSELIVLEFPDHHKYSRKDIGKIIDTYKDIFSMKKAILTTEKDAMRLIKSRLMDHLKDYPVFYVPINIVFQDKEKNAFNKLVLDYVRKDKGKRELSEKENNPSTNDRDRAGNRTARTGR